MGTPHTWIAPQHGSFKLTFFDHNLTLPVVYVANLMRVAIQVSQAELTQLINTPSLKSSESAVVSPISNSMFSALLRDLECFLLKKPLRTNMYGVQIPTFSPVTCINDKLITYPWYYCSGRYVRHQLIHLIKIFTNSILNLVWMILPLHYMFYNFYWVLQLLCNPWWIFRLLLAFVLLNNLWDSATHWMSAYKGQKHPLTGKYNSVLWKLSSRILQIWVPIKIDLH